MNQHGARWQSRLAPLELEILRGLAEGLQTKELATSLGRSTPTIDSYVRLLLARFDARTRAHLVARAFACGVLLSEAASEGDSAIASAS